MYVSPTSSVHQVCLQKGSRNKDIPIGMGTPKSSYKYHLAIRGSGLLGIIPDSRAGNKPYEEKYKMNQEKLNMINKLKKRRMEKCQHDPEVSLKGRGVP